MDSGEGVTPVKRLFPAVYLVTMLGIVGCGVSQPMQPVNEGETEIIASFGGPVIPLDGFAVPAPYLNVGAVYGAASNFSLFGNAHLTAALFKDLGVDAGLVTTVAEEEGLLPEINLNGRVYFFWDVVRSNNKRLFPLVTVTAHYTIAERKRLYVGADNLVQLHRPEYFISPLAGYLFPLSDRMFAQLELKWLAANKETRHGIFEGTTSLGGKGGIGLFFGIQFPLR